MTPYERIQAELANTASEAKAPSSAGEIQVGHNEQQTTIPAQQNPSSPEVQMSALDRINQAIGEAPAQVPSRPTAQPLPTPEPAPQAGPSALEQINQEIKSMSETPEVPAVNLQIDPKRLKEAGDDIIAQANAGMPVDPLKLSTAIVNAVNEGKGWHAAKALTTPIASYFSSLGSVFGPAVKFMGKYALDPAAQILDFVNPGSIVRKAGFLTPDMAAGPMEKFTPVLGAAMIAGKQVSDWLRPQVGEAIESADQPLKLGTTDLRPTTDIAGNPVDLPEQDHPLQIKYGPIMGTILEHIETQSHLPLKSLPDRQIIGAFADVMLTVGTGKMLGAFAKAAKVAEDLEGVGKMATATEATEEGVVATKTATELGPYSSLVAMAEAGLKMTPEQLMWREQEFITQEKAAIAKIGKETAAQTASNLWPAEHLARQAERAKAVEAGTMTERAAEAADMKDNLDRAASLLSPEEKALAKQIEKVSIVEKGDLPIGNVLIRNGQPIKEIGDVEKTIAMHNVAEDTAKLGATPEELRASLMNEVTAGDIAEAVGERVSVWDKAMGLPVVGKAVEGTVKTGNTIKTIFKSLISPWYVAPKLYALKMMQDGLIAKTIWPYAQRLKPFQDIIPERLTVISKLLDGGVSKYPEMAGELMKLNPHELDAMRAFRENWANAASDIYRITKLKGVAPENLMSSYFTHVITDLKTQKSVLSENMEGLAKIGDRYSKARKAGSTASYTLNPFDAFKHYIEWGAERIADEIVRPKWQKALAETTSAEDKSYGVWYWDHIHGKDYGMVTPAVRGAFDSIRSRIYRSCLGWNLHSAWSNRSQYFLFASARMGWGAANRGLILLGESKKATEQGAALQKVLGESGMFGQMSEFLTASKLETVGVAEKESFLSGMRLFSQTEYDNKVGTYLGSHEKVMHDLAMVQSAPGKFPKTEAELLSWKVDLKGTPEVEARMAAYRNTIETQADFSRGGQSQLQAIPVVNLGLMFSSFPLRTGEYMAMTVAKATKAVYSRGGMLGFVNPSAYMQPEVRELVRLGINMALLKAGTAMAGISMNSVFGMESVVPNLSPALMMGVHLAQTVIEAKGGMSNDDSYFGKRGQDLLIKDATMLSGIPGSMQLFKLAAFLKTANDNLYVHPDQVAKHGGLWTVYGKDGNPKYRLQPHMLIVGLAFQTRTAEEYYDQAAARSKEAQDRSNKSQQLHSLMRQGKTEEAQDLAQDYGMRAKRITRAEKIRMQYTPAEWDVRQKRKRHGHQ